MIQKHKNKMETGIPVSFTSLSFLMKLKVGNIEKERHYAEIG